MQDCASVQRTSGRGEVSACPQPDPAHGAAARPPATAKSRAQIAFLACAYPGPRAAPLDLIGLGLFAAGVFLAFPLYLDWDAGVGGAALVDGLLWLLGQRRLRGPVRLLMGAGAVLVMRPVLPAVRPFRAAAFCLVGGADALLRVGHARARRAARHAPRLGSPCTSRSAAARSARRCTPGAARLAGDVGSHILALFLLIAGVLLLTGASIAGAMRATSSGVADTTRVIRRTAAPRDSAARVASRSDGPGAAAAARAGGRGAGRAHRRAPADASTAPIASPTCSARPIRRRRAARRAPRRSPRPSSRAGRRSPRASAARAARPEPAPAEGEFVSPRRRAAAPLEPRQRPARHRRPGARLDALLVEALGHHGVEAKVVATVAGPHITRYELRLAPGVKMNKVGNLKDDLAYALAATEIRILAPIPGKQAVGVEVPNRRRRVVTLGDVFGAAPADASPLTVFLGKDVSGKPVHADLDEDAAPARRGHDRRRQVGLRQRDAELDPAAHDAGPGAARARRSQAGRAQPLRGDPAPADAGHHEPADGGQRAPEPRARDGVALRRDVGRPHALADRAQQAPHGAPATRRCPTSCA